MLQNDSVQDAYLKVAQAYENFVTATVYSVNNDYNASM